MKICSKCKVEKDESAFHKHKSHSDGLSTHCKACIALIGAKYYKLHRDSRLAFQKDYAKQNRDKITKSQQRSRTTNPLVRLKIQLGNLIRVKFKQGGFTKKSKASVIIGCSYEQFMTWLGPKPCDDAEIDHLCPVSQAKSEEEMVKLNHYSNLQWLPASENRSKSDTKTPAGELLCRTLLGREWID